MEPLSITGFTTVNALGRGRAATMAALREKRSGLKPCDFAGCQIDTFVGAVDGLEGAPVIEELREFDCRNNRLAQVGLQTDDFEGVVAKAIERYGPDRIATVMGSSTSGLREGEIAYELRDPAGGDLPQDFCFDHTHDFFSLSDFVRRYLRLSGPAVTITTACSSSSKAFVDAWQMIDTGLCDAAVVGGVDSLTLLCLYGFKSLELLSTEPCRPNDAGRAGISIGEAAGFALLERVGKEPPTRDPGDEIGLLGFGESTDAHHMSSPHPEGKGAEMAMRVALSRSNLRADDISYVNLHGTGTPINDRVEDLAVNAVFGSSIPCSSTKGWTGHTLGASGITEAVISCLCISEGFVPGNLNLQTVDPEFRCSIATEAETRPVERVLSNSFGFGGNNCSLILGRLP